MNNYSNANVRAAGYSQNNNTWYFYQPTKSYKIQGLKESETSIAVDGITYHIKVGACETADEVQEVLKDAAVEADTLLQKDDLDTEYTAESVKALKDAYQRVQNILEGSEEYIKDNNKNEGDPQPPVVLPELQSVHSYKNADYIVTSATEAGGTVTYKQPAKKKW